MTVQSNWELPETLQLLAASGDAELVTEIIDVFKSDTARRLLLMREALAQMDPARVGQQAHAIKGSAIQVGADSLASLCQRIELEAPARTCPELETLVTQAEADFEGLCRAEAIVR